MLKRVSDELSEIGKVVLPPKVRGQTVFTVFAPKFVYHKLYYHTEAVVKPIR
jgi:hypothetical protein